MFKNIGKNYFEMTKLDKETFVFFISKLNVELMQEWIAELRSGNYKQGKNRLFNKETGGFCCLGVLCMIKSFDRIIRNNYETYIPFFDFVRLIEFNNNESLDKFQGALGEYNDNGTTFEEIATALEYLLKEYQNV